MPMMFVLAWLQLFVAHAGPWPELDLPPAAQEPARQDVAVIVGVESYQHVPPVPGAADNAEAWYRWLVKSRGVPAERVRLLLDDNAVEYEVREAVAELAAQVGSDGTFWFVFVGHGATNAAGEPLMLGPDVQASAESFERRGVRQAELLEMLDRSSAGGVVAVLDTCFSGQSTSGQTLLKGYQPLVPHKELAARPGTVLLTAGSSSQYAGPLPGADRPAFSYLALGALRGWADGDGDGQVTSGEVHRYTRDVMKTIVRGRQQVPQLIGSAQVVLGRALELGPDLAEVVLAVERASPVERGVVLDRGEDIVNAPTDQTGYLFVTASHDRAAIFVNGEHVGDGKVQLERPVGLYVITGELGRLYHPDRVEVELDTDGVAVDLELAPAFGSIEIRSQPAGATVWLDGEPVGKTPLSLEEKPAGEYRIEVAKELYARHQERIEVQEGQATRRQVALEVNYGRILVQSTPEGAAILVNGRPTGQVTPATLERQATGLAQVALELDGYGREVVDVDIVAGGSARARAILTPRLAVLKVAVEDAAGEPCRAEVSVGGRVAGTAPLSLELPATRHELTADCGGETAWTEVDLVHNQATSELLQTSLPGNRGRLRLTIMEPDGLPCEGEVTVDGKVVDSDASYLVLDVGEHRLMAICATSATRGTLTVAAGVHEKVIQASPFVSRALSARVTDIDDRAWIELNGVKVLEGRYGVGGGDPRKPGATEWEDIDRPLRAGFNDLRMVVDNDSGGSSGTFEVRAGRELIAVHSMPRSTNKRGIVFDETISFPVAPARAGDRSALLPPSELSHADRQDLLSEADRLEVRAKKDRGLTYGFAVAGGLTVVAVGVGAAEGTDAAGGLALAGGFGVGAIVTELLRAKRLKKAQRMRAEAR